MLSLDDDYLVASCDHPSRVAVIDIRHSRVLPAKRHHIRLGPIECESSRFFAIFDISLCRMRLTRVAKVLRSPITCEGFAPEIFLVRPLQNPPPTHQQKKHRHDLRPLV